MNPVVATAGSFFGAGCIEIYEMTYTAAEAISYGKLREIEQPAQRRRDIGVIKRPMVYQIARDQR